MQLLQLSIFLFLHFLLLKPASPTTTDLTNICPTTCGNISIPYPFGLGESRCYRPGFNLTCDLSLQPPRLFLGDGSVEVIDISLIHGTVTINTKVLSFLSSNLNESWTGLLPDGPFTISSKNRFTAIGCGVLARVLFYETNTLISLCASVCVARDFTPGHDDTCAGIGCCQTSIPMGLTTFDVHLESLNETTYSFGEFNKVFVVDKDWFDDNGDVRKKLLSPLYSKHPWDSTVSTEIPALLDWWLGNGSNGTGGLSCEMAKKNTSEFVCRSMNSWCYDNANGNGYRCNCSDGYQGNPYVNNGCQDIDECQQPEVYKCDGTCVNEVGTYKCYSNDPHKYPGLIITIGVTTGLGLLVLLLGAFLLTRKLKARRDKMQRDKFFKQNKGLLLQHLISSNKDVAERMKIFSLEELKKATSNFDKSRIVGQGGHGIVYKGILSDQRVAAIKKPQEIIQREIEQFINEVAILSQLNHRNVVKLFGCCLETEVPLLVYEFISNGTLSSHLHAGNQQSLSWDDRLKIALEIARALSYLHSAASISIFHRDIKSANVLLDDGLTAKLSDFGASRSVPVDQTAVSTAIQGTYGYLDPEYYYSGRLTEKSDVYSFGVILVELLTREKPTSSSKSQDGESLIPHFISLIRDNRFTEILDPQVVEEARKEELVEVVELGEMCLRLKRDERPTMKQVEMKLEALRGSKKHIIHTWSCKRLDESRSLDMSMSIEGSSSGDMTRQFSLEKDMMNSMSFSR
ncbi:Wall-associated kinase family protein [Rhynchospora pubera]|uniref:Wall-associated kinase family protein n=1 Tax=Rhynchospora pubera TaxID=906938 RepID=A0AAV8CX07_9POAL|nr:Wall-associated kinase family protein [Rhynchospora pubera]